MSHPISKIIDDLYLKKANGEPNLKKIVFFIGSGFLRIGNLLNDENLFKKFKRDFPPLARLLNNINSKKFQDYKWQHFETSRFYSQYCLPSLPHYLIYQLAKDGLCSDVITTNYDLFFDSLWEKKMDLPVAKNPICNVSEYDWEGYYSQIPFDEGVVRYWKIHGSLSHVMFRAKDPTLTPVILQLPHFPISGNYPYLSNAFPDLPMVPPFLVETQKYGGTKFLPHDQFETTYHPYIDWDIRNDQRKLNRDAFHREIQGAMNVLLNTDCIAAIILVGFTAYKNTAPVKKIIKDKDPQDEEMEEVLRGINNVGTPPIFMALHESQFQKVIKNTAAKYPKYSLANELKHLGRLYHYDETEKFFESFLGPGNSLEFNYKRAQNDYEIFSNYYLDFPEFIFGG